MLAGETGSSSLIAFNWVINENDLVSPVKLAEKKTRRNAPFVIGARENIPFMSLLT